MDHRERLLEIVMEKGPLLPSQINRSLNTNVLFASAMLAEMVEQKKLKISNLKIGGSPLYFCEGQEHMLERFADKLDAPYLNAFDILRSRKIIRDRDQEPAVRVSLREIKDFAVPLEVTANGVSDLFWKYYLVEDSDAKSLIKEYIESKIAAARSTQEHKKGREMQAKISSVEEIQRPQQSAGTDIASSLSGTYDSGGGFDFSDWSYAPAFSFNTAIDTDELVKFEKRKEEPVIEAQKVLAFPEGDAFFDKVSAFLKSAEIEITDFSIVKKGSEFDMVVSVPSNIGALSYCCKAKSKKKISEDDLASAFVQGYLKKIPVLFLTDGELAPKTKDLVAKEFKSLIFKRI